MTFRALDKTRTYVLLYLHACITFSSIEIGSSELFSFVFYFYLEFRIWCLEFTPGVVFRLFFGINHAWMGKIHVWIVSLIFDFPKEMSCVGQYCRPGQLEIMVLDEFYCFIVSSRALGIE
jgi:hypothetical protein